MVDYHPFSDEIFDDPFPVYRRLRDEAPALYLEEFDCWFVSRFEDVWRLESDQTPFTTKKGVTTTHLLTGQTPIAHNPSLIDPPEHTRVRSFLSPAFMPAAVRRLEPGVRGLARECVDGIADRGEFDALDLGGRLSVRVVCRILGLPVADADTLAGWVNAYFERDPGRRGTTERGIVAAKDMHLYLLGLVRERRRSGERGEALLDRYLDADFGSGPLRDADLAGHLSMLLIGGTETFPKVFSAAVHRLWEHPDQRARCAADPDLLPDAFAETLRIDMPTQMLGRTVVRDVELHDHTLRPGQGVMFLWGSANRDEREFADPDTFDIERRAPRILSFGHGIHMCLGAHVARMEGRLLLGELLSRMPEYEVDLARAERLRSEFFRGFRTLPVCF